MISPSAIFAYACLQTLIHYGAESATARKWGLSACNSVLMSFYGICTVFQWLVFHDLAATAFTDSILYRLQAYLIVDLVYNRAERQNLLEFWVHHSIYVVLTAAIVAGNTSGLVAPYFIMEIPTAIRSVGTVNPAWRSDAGFGLTFFALRILLPVVVMVRDHAVYPTGYLAVFVGMLAVHFYWFFLWCRPRLLDLWLTGTGGNHVA